MKEKKERFSQVSNEVAEKARHCKTHEELMQKSEIYREIYEQQNRGGEIHE